MVDAVAIAAARNGSATRKPSLGESLVRARYKYIPDHVLGEILTKRWIDNVAPFTFLIITVALFGYLIPDFFSPASLVVSLRQLGEFGFVVLAMMIVMVAGGIDLSVGSNFALGNFTALAVMNILGWPVGVAFLCTLAACCLVGLLNGMLVGLLRLRAFLTTLVTLIIVRAVVDMLLLKYAVQISGGFADSEIWDFIGSGSVFGLPFSVDSARRCRADRSRACSAARVRAGESWRSADRGARRTIPAFRCAGPFAAPTSCRARSSGSPDLCTRRGYQRRRRRRLWHGTRRADGGSPRRQQSRRRPRIDWQSADRGDYRPCHYQRRRAARHSERRRRHAAWPYLAFGRRSRRALAQEPSQGSVESLCLADRQRSAAVPADRGRFRLPVRGQRQTQRRRTHRPRPGRGARGRHLRSQPTTSIAGRDTAT